MTQQHALILLKSGRNIFLTGQAGSGKTHVLHQYIAYAKDQHKRVAVTAATGIAATQLGGGTIHSWAGIGIKPALSPSELELLAGNELTQLKIRTTDVLIIDEISMVHAYRLDYVNQICQLVRESTEAFGGMQVILCGDFFQLPPINEKDMPQNNFAFKSASWDELNVTVCYLTEQHRQFDDEFLRLLEHIRSQEVTEYTIEALQKRMHQPVNRGAMPTKLYTHNGDVDMINAAALGKIKAPLRYFPMTGKGHPALVATLKKSCLAPETLLLKKGAFVMFLKNNPAKGYVNGTLGEVTDFDEDGFPIVTTHLGKTITASPASWQIMEDEVILAEISQIPLRLAWAITVHKSQGMSLDAAEMDLSRSFAFGMGYVALSRVRSLDGITLLGLNAMALQVNSDIADFDHMLKQASEEVDRNLRQLSKKAIREH